MLVLTRKVGERIRIGSDVEIVLVSIGGNRARVGVIAPPFLRVMRPELECDDKNADDRQKRDT